MKNMSIVTSITMIAITVLDCKIINESSMHVEILKQVMSLISYLPIYFITIQLIP